MDSTIFWSSSDTSTICNSSWKSTMVYGLIRFADAAAHTVAFWKVLVVISKEISSYSRPIAMSFSAVPNAPRRG